MTRPRPSDALFDLGDFAVDREVAGLVPFAEVQRLVRAHGRKDWGRVSAKERLDNEAFAHPKNRAVLTSARSVHRAGNVLLVVRTIQGKGRRTTRISIA